MKCVLSGGRKRLVYRLCWSKGPRSLFVLYCLVWAFLTVLAKEPMPSLVPNTSTVFQLNSESSLTIALNCEYGKIFEILIETSAPGADFILLSPRGEKVFRATIEQPGWLAISSLADQQGQYLLVTRTSSAFDTDGLSVRMDFALFPALSRPSIVRAEAFFAEAHSLANSQNSAPLRNAITKYQQARENWKVAGSLNGQVVALAGEAQGWLDLSEYNNALITLNSARLLGRQNPFFRAWLANRLAQVYLDKMDSLSAKRYIDEAFTESLTLYDSWLKADIFADQAESAYYLSQVSSEQVIDAQALQLSQQSHATRAMARALRCSAWIRESEGHLTKAMSLLEQAELAFQKAGDSRDAAIGMSDIAVNLSMSGDLYSAAVRQTKLVPLIRDSGDRTNYAYLLGNIAADYAQLNRIGDAVVYYKQAVKLLHELGHQGGETGYLSELCVNQMATQDVHGALEDCKESLTMARLIGDPKRIAVVTLQLGKAQRLAGHSGAALASFQKASRLSVNARDVGTEIRSLVEWGSILDDMKRPVEARLILEKAVPLTRDAEDAQEQVEVGYLIARSDFRAGRVEDAKQELSVVLDQVQVQRRLVGNGDLQTSYFAQMRKCHDLYVDILMKEQERDPSSGAAARALEMSESGRALTLLDTLAARDGKTVGERQSATSQQMRELHTAVESAYDQRLKLMIEGGKSRELDSNAAALTQAIDMLERAEDEQKAALVSPPTVGRTLTTEEIVAASGKSPVTMVEYSLAADRSYVWVIQNGKIESHILPPRDRIASAIDKWRSLATARTVRIGESFEDHRKRVEVADKKLPAVAAALSCMLLGPFLRPSMERLEVVPDGELQLLPFAALPENGCAGGGEPLGASHQVEFTPSLSVLLARHDMAAPPIFQGDVALIADPVFDRDDPRVHRAEDAAASTHPASFVPALPRLASTREEAEAIAALAGPARTALYLDFDASLQTLLSSSLVNYRILHVASHGVLDENTPGFFGIVLSLVDRSGQPVFGYLKGRDIAGLDLNTELVVLSSCDSASGINLSGEGITGLNHAFLSAGAKRVVSTLWSVDDDASRQLMTGFYRGMLQNSLSPSEALRRSQVSMMHNPRTAAPYFWAGFSITSTIQ